MTFIKGKTSWNKGKSWTEEIRKRMSEARKGKGVGRDNAMYGKHHMPETRSKIARAKIGKRLSEDTREKMSETHKKRLAETGIKPSDWGAGFALHPWSTQEYNNTRFVYFAGLFDGEGSVMIISDGRQMGLNIDNRYKKVAVSISMVDKEPLEEGYKYFGGSLHKRPGRGNGREYWQWKIDSGKQIDFFLRNIRKFVRIKGARIDLALQYRNRLKNKINTGGRRALNENELQLRNEIQKELKQLNQRGVRI